MEFVFSDGGRVDSGRSKNAGDCVCRAICNATGLPYEDVYSFLANGNASQRKTKCMRASAKKRSANHGIYVRRKWFRDYMQQLGFTWTSTMSIGSGCNVHLRKEELPQGILVVQVSKHMTCVKGGAIYDTYNPDRNGTRCVYGYWTLHNNKKG